MSSARIIIPPGSGVVSEDITGVEFDGTAGANGPTYADADLKRGFYVPAGAANGCTATPCTVLMRQMHRDQVGTSERYYCGFFYGNHEDFDDFADYGRAYMGVHGYPIGVGGSGNICLELAGGIGFGSPTDDTTREDSSQPTVDFDEWLRIGLVTAHSGSGPWTRKLYCDLPSVADADRIENDRDNSAGDVEPPVPVFMFGQTGQRIDPPNNGLGRSWGGQIRWEEFRGVLRGIQIYAATLSEAHVVALSAFERNSEVTNYCNSNGLAVPWYLCMNPTPTDVNNRGTGPNAVWDSSDRPTLWTP